MNAQELQPRAEKALHFLIEKSAEHAEARAQAEHLADWVKVEKARLQGLYVGLSATASESEAMRHPDYLKALEALKIARMLWYEAQFRRDAADCMIRAWQTCCSNERRV